MSGSGFGYGKLILCGEHAVVYGHPAIAFAVDLRTEVTLTPCPGPTSVWARPDDSRLLEAVKTLLGEEGHEVRIVSSLPLGRGMGSSAALGVALVRAAADLAGEDLDPDSTYRRAMPCERIFHGNPSGLDVAVSIRGGCIHFTRGEPPSLLPLRPGPWRVVVLDTEEVGDTAALVASVAAGRPGVDPTLHAIGALVGRCVDSLGDARRLGPLLTENHLLLAALGVSTSHLDDLVRLALEAGALGAKLSGAGGGGVAFALADSDRTTEQIREAAVQRGVPHHVCRPVGSRGAP